MITKILIGESTAMAANSLLKSEVIVAYQSLAPEHVNTVRIMLPLTDDASPRAQKIYCGGVRFAMDHLAMDHWVKVVDDDYLTYGNPTARLWVTEPQ